MAGGVVSQESGFLGKGSGAARQGGGVELVAELVGVCRTKAVHVSNDCPCSQTMLRIWDTFLYEGSKVLFRFALAIFKHNEEKIMEKTTSIGIFNHLRTMCQDATDVETLVRVCGGGGVWGALSGHN